MPMIAAHWLWLVAALALVGAETVAPGLFLFWLGLAAGAVGLTLVVLPLSVTAQLALFSVLAVLAVLAGRLFGRREGDAADAPFLNRRGSALVGRVLPLETALADGTGTVRIDDTVWRVNGPPAPAQTLVRIVRVDGAVLTVERA